MVVLTGRNLKIRTPFFRPPPRARAVDNWMHSDRDLIMSARRRIYAQRDCVHCTTTTYSIYTLFAIYLYEWSKSKKMRKMPKSFKLIQCMSHILNKATETTPQDEPLIRANPALRGHRAGAVGFGLVVAAKPARQQH